MSVILSEVKGFTPVIDVVAKELGFITAGVYGLVWRHCQMNDRICRASVQTLAETLDVSSNTIRRHLKKLVDGGYIIDTTPGRLNAPHIYKDAGKVKIDGLLEAKEDTQKGTPTKKVTHREQPDTQKGQARLPRESTEDTIEESNKDTIDGRLWFIALSELCVVNLNVATKTQKAQLGQSSKILKKSGATPEQIVSFGKWWYSEDWRGKQGQAPTPAQVRSEWGKFTASGSNGRRVITLGR